LVAEIVQRDATLLMQAEIILAKKETGRPITAEDFQTLSQVIQRIEGRFEASAEEERKAQDAARKSVPAHLWQIPIDILDLSEPTDAQLRQNGFDTVGHVMAGLGYDLDQFRERVGLDDAALAEIQERVATTDFPVTVEEPPSAAAEPTEPEEQDATPVLAEDADQQPVAESDEIELAEEQLDGPISPLYEEPPEELLISVPEPAAKPEPQPVSEPQVEKQPVRKAPPISLARQVEDDEFPAKKKGKGKRKRRQLVFDEDAGAVVTRRKRKRGQESEWDEYLD